MRIRLATPWPEAEQQAYWVHRLATDQVEQVTEVLRVHLGDDSQPFDPRAVLRYKRIKPANPDLETTTSMP